MTARFAWLSEEPLRSVLAVLHRDGEEARVVGGAVRNTLLGESVSEWDIATTALPAVVSERARDRGWKVVPTGIEHGTVTLVASGRPFEVTTLREDVETFGRHAVVRFGRDFAQDALRRDFTINALSVDPAGTLFDYANGLADLERRAVRFIGDARQRIEEDYLRILRFFRFHARYGAGDPDPVALDACIRGRGWLDQLSRERIRAELLKLLEAQRAASALVAMADAGLLSSLLHGVARVGVFERLVQLEATNGHEPDPMRRLAALACFVREDAERLAALLRLSNAEARKLAAMAATAESLSTVPDEPRLRALCYRAGPTMLADALMLAAARSDAASWQTAIAYASSHVPSALPWRAADLTAAGLTPGPALGAALAELERRWIAADFPSDPLFLKVVLDEVAKDALRGRPPTPSAGT